jgi:hypothetical protein
MSKVVEFWTQGLTLAKQCSTTWATPLAEWGIGKYVESEDIMKYFHFYFENKHLIWELQTVINIFTGDNDLKNCQLFSDCHIVPFVPYLERWSLKYGQWIPVDHQDPSRNAWAHKVKLIFIMLLRLFVLFSVLTHA